MEWLEKLRWDIILIACATLGLAPYRPPHLWEKFHMLVHGRLHRAIDWLDLLLHGIPWLLLILKGLFWLKKQ
jgi:hypothetical protein